MKKEKAYLTLLANDAYIYCVIALYASWLKTSSKYKFYCACTPDVSDTIRNNLKEMNIGIIDLPKISGLEVLADKLMTSGYKSWVPALSKLAIYGLEQFSKFIFLDADTYVYKNLDHLFDKPHMTAVPDGVGRSTADYKFVPGDNYFKKFNAGMVVVEPSKELLETIIESTKTLQVDRPWADQNIVSELYPGWIKDTSKQLPVYYNCLGRHIWEYEYNIPGFDINDICVLHMVGPKMSPTYNFDTYFKDNKHASFCKLVIDILTETNKFISDNKRKGLLSNISLVKVPQQYDLVVPYVDSSDENWQVLFDKYNSEERELEAVNARNRFRGQGEFFRFFFRGVSKFMPWIRKVFLIVQSESQVPYWIDRSKVQIVYHKDFIPEQYLPTFNSTAIEMFLWKIPGLSERFIYANDDMFVTKPLTKDNFFYNDKINLKFKHFRVSREKSTIYGHHVHNGHELILGKTTPVLEPVHTLRGYDKVLMRECFMKYEKQILDSISQFRTKDNYNIYIYDYYQYSKGVTCTHDVPTAEAFYIRNNTDPEEELSGKLRKHVFSILCVQDVMRDRDVYSNTFLRAWFKGIFPGKAKYEDTERNIIPPDKMEAINKTVARLPARIRESVKAKLVNKYVL